MVYVRKQWSDRSVQFPGRYAKSGESSSLVTLTESPGTVTQAGTPLNAANMNNIEDGIEERATWDAMRSAEREIATLKMLSTLKTKVDGASDFYFDDIALKNVAPDGSSMDIDMTQATISVGITPGATTCTVLNVSGLVVGMEVTLQSISTPAQLERKGIKTISGNLITFTTAVTGAYPAGSLIYRSLVNRLTAGNMKFQKASSIVQPLVLTGTEIGYAKLTTDAGTFVYPDFNSFQNNFSTRDICLSPGGDYMVNKIHNGTTINVYKRYGTSFVTVQTITIPGLLGIDLSSDGKWLVCIVQVPTSGTTSPVWIYKFTNGQFIQLPASSVTGITIGSNWPAIDNSNNFLIDWHISPSTNYIGVTYRSSSTIYMLKRTGDTWALSSNCTTPQNYLSAFSFSYDDKFVAWCTIWNPNNAGVMKNNGTGTWTSLIYPLANMSNYYSGFVQFSPDGKYLYLDQGTQSSYRNARIYAISGDTFTNWIDYQGIYGIAGFFTPDSKYLYISSTSSNDAKIYRIAMDKSGTGVGIPFVPAKPSTVSSMLIDPTGMIGYDSSIGFISNPLSLSIDVPTADIRYKTKVNKPVSGAVAFIEKSSAVALTISAALSVDTGSEVYAAMDADPNETIDSTTISTAFSKALPAGTSATLRITMTRSSPSLDTSITKVTGATE